MKKLTVIIIILFLCDLISFSQSKKELNTTVKRMKKEAAIQQLKLDQLNEMKKNRKAEISVQAAIIEFQEDYLGRCRTCPLTTETPNFYQKVINNACNPVRLDSTFISKKEFQEEVKLALADMEITPDENKLISSLSQLLNITAYENKDIVEELWNNYESSIIYVYDVVEENPEFNGGMVKLYEYLEKNIQYPEMAKENGIQGRVYVQFVVLKDGTIRDVKVVKSVHKTLDNEAKRVVKTMPKWTPGKQRGKAVNARFTLPIKFRIPSGK